MSGQEVISEHSLLTGWHWSLELLFYFAPTLIGILGTARQSILVRNDFAMRVILSVFVSLLVLYFSVYRVARELSLLDDLNLMLFAAGILLSFLYGRWCTLRLNHIGWSRWFALLLLVPIVNILGVIALFFIPGRKPHAQEAIAAP